MLEMLNPTGGDLLRFAATVVKVRSKLNRAMKDDPAKAQALAVETFCAPPMATRRTPDIARLRDDAKRFFGWNSERWSAQEASVRALIDNAQTYTVLHDGLKVQCYRWMPSAERQKLVGLNNAYKANKIRGRILLCHGWEGYALNFALLIQRALDAGYEVHAFDHLAHGRSEGTQSGLPIALETLLTVSAHVKKQHGDIDVLVGHSLGGAAASWASAHKKIEPKRLVLIAPFYDTRKLSGLWAKAHFLSEDIRAALQMGLEKASGKKFEDFMPPALAEKFATKPVLPVLILHDQADKITAFKHSAALAHACPTITLHEVRKVGHIAVLADDASADVVMEFIRS
jgi:alpha-beta hydrolase superfamily lysophospholipase